MKNTHTYTHTHIHTYTHTHTYIHTYTHIHIHIYTHIHIHIHTHIYTYTCTIEIYGPQPTNTNIWPSATPTANQYKHMAQRRIIETYGHTIAGRRSFVCASGRFFYLRWCPRSTHYSRVLVIFVL